MRRVAGLPVCLALLLAFLMAPFQHIHLVTSHEGHKNHDHDGAVIHTHFYQEAVPAGRNGGSDLKDSHGNHDSQSLDTYSLLLQHGFPALVRPESRILFFHPADLLLGIVESTEARGHDPPFLDFSIPRAPPV